MKRLVAIVLLCWSAGVMAEAAPKQIAENVWYCVEVASAGLGFEDGRYETTTFKLERITIKQDGLKFTFPDKSMYALMQGEVECRLFRTAKLALVFSCQSWDRRTSFDLNPDTGLASFAFYDGGWALADKRPDASSSVSDMAVTALECETF